MGWEVVGVGTGAEVTVTWDCYLKTFDTRVLGGPLHKRQLAREVAKSLTVMASAVMAIEPRRRGSPAQCVRAAPDR
jgi:hypothetical protein